jgi:tetratricopeptide (TPR) repeat protein
MSQDWSQIQLLFEQALDVPESGRLAFLEAQTADPAIRQEVLELLAFDSRGLTRVNSALGAAAQQLTALAPDTLIGPWRIRRILGQGGMGAVYEVERADGAYHQIAALKRIRSDAQSAEGLRRFLEERDILARLNHPNIARLLDGGADSSGQPYLVMEAVDGLPITAYCEQNKLSLRQKLTLFLDVCKAVQSAHNRLVIHRDLKPSNIHVTHDGAVKLLDFGIAKLLDPASASATLTGHLALTPEYASPEQVSGQDVSTASDIYSLGAVLFELLTGTKAHNLTSTSPAEIVRVILESEPPAGSLSGDLLVLVQAAMQKLPERRYGSVDRLAEDIERFLTGRPLLARPDSLSYKAGKFLRRNWFGVAAAAVVAVSLISAAAISTLQARRAQKRFDQVRALANTFLFDFHDKIRDLPGSTPAREMVAATARTYLDNLAADAANDPRLQLETATAYERLGDVLGSISTPSLGRTQEARQMYERSFQLRQAAAQALPADAAAGAALTAAYIKLSDGHRIAGQTAEALRLAELAATRARAASDWKQLYGAISRVSDHYSRLGESSRCLPLLEEALQIANRYPQLWPGEDSYARVSILVRIAREQKMLAQGKLAFATINSGIEEVERALAKTPNEPKWLRHGATLHSERGDIHTLPSLKGAPDWKSARQDYMAALAFSERMRALDPSSYTNLYDAFFNELQVAAATRHLGDPAAIALLEATAAKLDKAVASHPNQAEGRRYRFMAYGTAASAAADFRQWPRALRLYDVAVTLMDEILTLDPNRLPKREPVAILLERARAAAALGQPAKAAADLQRCRTLSDRIPVPKARPSDLRITGDCYIVSAEQAPPRQAAVYYKEALRRFDEALNRPQPAAYLQDRRNKTAAALAKLP